MRKFMLAAAFLAAASTAPAAAQVNVSQGLVDVTIQNVSILNNFLNGAQIAALNNLAVPIHAAVPISVAANVCGLSVAALAEQRRTGDATCTATSASRALAQAVARQNLNQNR